QALTNSLQEEINTALNETKKSTELVEKGIAVSNQTNEKIDLILKAIEDNQLDIHSVRQMIEEQKSLAADVKNELQAAQKLFASAHDLVVTHIADAEEVDKRLEKGVQLLDI